MSDFESLRAEIATVNEKIDKVEEEISSVDTAITEARGHVLNNDNKEFWESELVQNFFLCISEKYFSYLREFGISNIFVTLSPFVTILRKLSQNSEISIPDTARIVFYCIYISLTFTGARR